MLSAVGTSTEIAIQFFSKRCRIPTLVGLFGRFNIGSFYETSGIHPLYFFLQVRELPFNYSFIFRGKIIRIILFSIFVKLLTIRQVESESRDLDYFRCSIKDDNAGGLFCWAIFIVWAYYYSRSISPKLGVAQYYQCYQTYKRRDTNLYPITIFYDNILSQIMVRR